MELNFVQAIAQNTASLSGRITSEGKPLASASININQQSLFSDSNGLYRLWNLTSGSYLIRVSNIGFESTVHKLSVLEGQQVRADFNLDPAQGILNEVVVTGVSRATLIKQNPVAIAFVSSKSIDRTIEPN